MKLIKIRNLNDLVPPEEEDIIIKCDLLTTDGVWVKDTLHMGKEGYTFIKIPYCDEFNLFLTQTADAEWIIWKVSAGVDTQCQH